VRTGFILSALTQALRRIEAGLADERGRPEILGRDLT
jgi:hypothetical protein